MRKLALKDVFTLTAIIEKLELRNEIAEIISKSEDGEDQAAFVGTQMFSILITKLNLIEEEVYTWIADLTGKTFEEAGLITFSEMKAVFKALVDDDGLKELFTSLASKEKN